MYNALFLLLFVLTLVIATVTIATVAYPVSSCIRDER